MKRHGAGLLVYRKKDGRLQVFLAHPGGPYWAKKDDGVWSIPKGDIDEEENAFEAAKREFQEETSQTAPSGKEIPLGEVRRRDGRLIKAWGVEGDIDVSKVKSNTVPIEWPPRSGQKIKIPEIDRAEWFDLAAAKHKIHDVQLPLLERLAANF